MINTKRYCKHGHDTYKTGRNRANGQCKVCQRKSNREVMRRFRNTPVDAQRFDPLEIPNLKKVREELGLTQKQLAQTTGVGEDHISNIERGVRRASARVRNLLIAAVVHEMSARKGKAI